MEPCYEKTQYRSRSWSNVLKEEYSWRNTAAWKNTAEESEPWYKRIQLRNRSHDYKNRELRIRSNFIFARAPQPVYNYQIFLSSSTLRRSSIKFSHLNSHLASARKALLQRPSQLESVGVNWLLTLPPAKMFPVDQRWKLHLMSLKNFSCSISRKQIGRIWFRWCVLPISHTGMLANQSQPTFWQRT